jgi:hypothetical protein
MVCGATALSALVVFGILVLLRKFQDDSEKKAASEG